MFKKFAIGAVALVTSLLPTGGVAFAATGTNLITNPSAETSANGTAPDSWSQGSWGTNTSTFSYETTGHTGSRSMRVDTTAYTDGAANWYHTPTTVAPNTVYDVSIWYKSNVAVEFDVEIAITGATTQNNNLGNAAASADWTEFKTTLTTPANAASIILYSPLNKVGYVVTDDYNLSVAGSTTPATGTFNEGMVTITFDDAWKSQISNAWPIMNTNGQKGTFYILTGSLGAEAYMTNDDVKALYAAGNEIGSHTVHHCDLANLNNATATTECPVPISAAQVQSEMVDSKAYLEQLIGGGFKVKSFAYPYGAYNASTIEVAKQAGYTNQRTVEAGYNTKEALDVTKLKIQEVQSTTTLDQVKAWIDGAKTQKAWLILMYHDIANTPVEGNDLYTATIPAFTDQMNYLKTSGVKVVTIEQALAIANGAKTGDITGDNAVNEADLSVMFANWNRANATVAQGNLNGDTTVDEADLSILFTNWSK